MENILTFQLNRRQKHLLQPKSSWNGVSHFETHNARHVFDGTQNSSMAVFYSMTDGHQSFQKWDLILIRVLNKTFFVQVINIIKNIL